MISSEVGTGRPPKVRDAGKDMSPWRTGYNRCYTCRGEGDTAAATAVQALLREHGTCSYFSWNPRPPFWRFFYETNLSPNELTQVLGSMIERFHLVIES